MPALVREIKKIITSGDDEGSFKTIVLVRILHRLHM